MSNLLISLAAEFTGKKAFKEAESATELLTKQAKNLAKAFGVGFGTAAIIGYGKAAVQAAANDQRAQQQLALALKNVGLGRDAAISEAFIQRLQSEFGIVDDKLRPAYQRLAVATRSTYESQKLLSLALDISASTGKDLDSVTSALSKAYLGSNTALSKLGIGISKADLKTKSFEDIASKLAITFKGAAAESAKTFAGSIDKLGVASQNVKEILGKGIVDALMILGQDTTVSQLGTDMETAATNAAALFKSIAQIIHQISVPMNAVAGSLAWFIQKAGPIVDLIVAGDPTKLMGNDKPVFKGMGNTTMTGNTNQDFQKSEAAARAKAAKDALDAAKKLAAIQAALLKTQKDQLKLDKAKAMFDLKKIGIATALKGNISPDAKNRLLAMQAIENGNADLATKYSSRINPNAATSVININAGTIVGSKEDLIDAVRDGLETIRRRSGAGVGR